MKVKRMRRFLSLSLSLMLAAATVPMNAFATEIDDNRTAIMERGGVLESEPVTETEAPPKSLTPRAISDVTIDIPKWKFSTITYGYVAPEYDVITVNNPGLDSVNVTNVKWPNEKLDVDTSDLRNNNYSVSIDAGGKYDKIKVRPVNGLSAGTYKETIIVTVASGADTKDITATVEFVVNKVVLVPEVDKVESKTYDKKKDAKGTLTLKAKESANQDIVKKEEPTATGTFKFDSEDVGKNKEVTVTDITLADKFKTNYELSTTKITDSVETTAEITKASQTSKPKEISVESIYYNAINVKVSKGQEYSIDGGKTWITTGNFSNLTANTKYTITTRIAATDNYKASKKADWKTTDLTTGRAPVISIPSNNTISGITANANYKLNTTLSFGAKGAGMDMTSPALGDVRYVPVSWRVVTGSSTASATTTSYSGSWTTWTGSTSSANFTPSTAGTYTLEVTFKKQEHNGTEWKDTSITDIKSVTFMTSSTGTTQNNTNTNSNGSTSNVAKTGDNTPIIMLCILLVLSIGVIAVYLVKRKKSK